MGARTGTRRTASAASAASADQGISICSAHNDQGRLRGRLTWRCAMRA